MTVHLRPITFANIVPCLRLRVRQNQRHLVAPNYLSLMQSIHPKAYPMGIYVGEVMVGFLMYGHFHYNGASRWFISRLMVDQHYQRCGYGRRAMQLAIDRLVTRYQAGTIWLSYSPDNRVALKLYHSLGFEPTGEATQGEVVVCLNTSRIQVEEQGA